MNIELTASASSEFEFRNSELILHIYRNGKKILVLAGKAAPKTIREDKLCEMVKDYE